MYLDIFEAKEEWHLPISIIVPVNIHLHYLQKSPIFTGQANIIVFLSVSEDVAFRTLSCSVKRSLTRNWLGRGMSLSHCSCTILLLGLVRPADKRLVQQMNMCAGPPTRSRHI